jgi:citrate lyase subunit beta/citryl-CoA lyase
VAAARLNDLVALDGVYNDLEDESGFEAECRQGADFGFDGKTLIHPRQIEPCNRLFSPQPDEVAFARAVIAAFALPENAGRGVIRVDGRMTERLHLAEAERLVAMDDQIKALRAT